MGDLRDLIYAIGFQVDDGDLNKAAKAQDNIDDNFKDIANSSKDVNKEINQGGNELDKVNKKTTNLEGSFKKLGKAIAGAWVTKKVIDFGKTAINVFADFEQSMANVKSVMGDITEGEFLKLEKAAREGGKTTKYTAGESADALYYMALAGFEVDEAIAALPHTLDLAAAGNLDLGRTADIVTDSMNLLGLKADELDVFVDQLAKTSQKTNTDIDMLGRGIIVAGGGAMDMGMSIQELNAWLGIFADNGKKGAEGGTLLRNVLLKLTSPLQKNAELLQDLGINISDKSTGKIRNLNDILLDLRGELGKYTEAQRNAIITSLGGAENVEALRIVLKGAGGDFENLRDQIEDSSGAAEQMADDQMNTLKGRFEELKSAIEESYIEMMTSSEVGATLKEVMEELTEKVPEFQDLVIGAFEGLGEALKYVLENGEDIIDIGAPLLGAILAWKGVSAVFGTFALLEGAIAGVGAAAELTTISMGPVGLGIAIVTGLGIALYRNWDDIKAKSGELKERLGENWKDVKGDFAKMTEEMKKNWEDFTYFLKHPIKATVEYIQTGRQEVKDNALSKAEEARKITNSTPVWNTRPDITTTPFGSNQTLQAFADGTHSTPNTFIAGENGPEIITNAPNRRVYNDKETKDILEKRSITVNPQIAIYIDGTNLNQFEIAQAVKRELKDYFDTLALQY